MLCRPGGRHPRAQLAVAKTTLLLQKSIVLMLRHFQQLLAAQRFILIYKENVDVELLRQSCS